MKTTAIERADVLTGACVTWTMHGEEEGGGGGEVSSVRVACTHFIDVIDIK